MPPPRAVTAPAPKQSLYRRAAYRVAREALANAMGCRPKDVNAVLLASLARELEKDYSSERTS